MRGPAGLWLVAWLTAAVLSSALGQTCQRSMLPWRTADGTDPVKMARGNVTVVALLLASWPMCQQQAEGLERLKTSYQQIGKRDITFLIVNHVAAKDSINELTRRVSFPVYQDDHTLSIQQKLNASIDDLFLYDRCSTLVYHLKKPESLVSQGTMQSSLLTTYLNNPCNCTNNSNSNVATEPTPKEQLTGSGSSHTSITRRKRHIVNNFGSSLVSMNSVVSHNGRVPKWTTHRWVAMRRNRALRYLLVRRLWKFIKKYRSDYEPQHSCVCPNPSPALKQECTWYGYGISNSVSFWSCQERSNTVYSECICNNCPAFRRRHRQQFVDDDTNCELLTSWHCNQENGLSATECSWQHQLAALEQHPSWHCHLEADDSLQDCQWQGSRGSWSWQEVGPNIQWQWPSEGASCLWESGSPTWQWQQMPVRNISWQWQVNPGETNSQTWQWHHDDGDCLWQCQQSINNVVTWQWPMGNTVDAYVSCSNPSALTGHWQWPLETSSTRNWQWLSDQSGVNSWSWQNSIGSWQWHTMDDSNLSWQCQDSTQTTETWYCQTPVDSTNDSVWQCRAVNGSWQWQTQTSGGIVWQEKAGRSWNWHPMWHWQVSTWYCRTGTYDDRAHCLWQPQTWQWQY